MMARGSLLVRIDPAALALIEEVATALDQAGLVDVLEELVDRGAFREQLETTSFIRGALHVRFGPWTELLLREFCDVARRSQWSREMKRQWMLQITTVAGFQGDESKGELL